ncbi:hypothetical protein CANCADRAFT_144317 [Tortispora caseinolytica NRRL Y-17796]|uniref:Translation initiation factor eIF2B subunit beta n=1 Tax=Tortispora caseinolytica NRRL Y-17796 TaxID=767744 RepID=A0A1E4TDR1_9ASCO|nr:hypothetical protein CANCADRAFT_144317 [Tortispora caseinolytica NRRL Y-17796]
MPDVFPLADALVSRLKRRELHLPAEIATATVQVMLRFVSAHRWSTVPQLIADTRAIGRLLQDAYPTENTAANVVRRVLALIREEERDEDPARNDTHMFSLLSSVEPAPSSKNAQELKPYIIQAIQEYADEIVSVNDSICALAVDIVHQGETLLTPTPGSETLLKFLLRAAQKRTFTLLITECYPNNTDRVGRFAETLSAAGVSVVIVPDAAVHTLISLVGKVVVGARSVMADGSATAAAGASIVCEAAHANRVPVVALAGTYKISPNQPVDVDALIEMGGPESILPFSNGNLVNSLDVVNPLWDFIPSKFISLYITNLGGFSPSFVYRLALDSYKADDVDL